MMLGGLALHRGQKCGSGLTFSAASFPFFILYPNTIVINEAIVCLDKEFQLIHLDFSEVIDKEKLVNGVPLLLMLVIYL